MKSIFTTILTLTSLTILLSSCNKEQELEDNLDEESARISQLETDFSEFKEKLENDFDDFQEKFNEMEEKFHQLEKE